MKLSNSLVAVLSLAVIAVGCAGGASGPGTSSSKSGLGPAAASGTVTAQDITDNASTFTQMYDNTAMTNPEGRNVLSSFDFNSMTIAAASDYDACSTTEGSSTDKDAVNIPYSYKVTYNCNGISTGTTTVNQTGSYTIKSKATNSTDRYAGFTMAFSITVATTGATYTSASTYGVNIETGLKDTTFSFVADAKAAQTFTPTSYHPDYTSSSTYNLAWTAPSGTAANDVLKQGTASLNGFYRLNITDKVIVFKFASANLTYDSTACPSTLYKDGTVTYTDGSGNEIVLTYSNCTLTKTFNGAAI